MSERETRSVLCLPFYRAKCVFEQVSTSYRAYVRRAGEYRLERPVLSGTTNGADLHADKVAQLVGTSKQAFRIITKQ